MVIAYKTIVQYQKQEIDIGIVFVIQYHFTCADLCNHHCTQDAELLHHYKNLPSATTYGHIHLLVSTIP